MRDVFDCDVFYDDSLESDVEDQQKVSVSDALVLSMNRYGDINFRYMEECSGESCNSMIAQLAGNGIWQDPALYEQNPDPETGWMLEEQYFSGNLVKKLKKAVEMNEKYPGRFFTNIKALKKRLPQMPELDEIFISLGSTWVPKEFYERFINDLLSPYLMPNVSYSDYLGKWKLSVLISDLSVKNCYVYGTSRMSAVKIIEHTMNAQPIKVMDAVDKADGSGKTYILNKEETLAAQEKQNLIIQAFEKWIHSDKAALEQLQEIYCEKYGYVSGQYDGSFLNLPDLNPDIQLYEHQKNAIARIVLSRNVLLAHDVGAGKTFEMVIGAHELKRMGLSSKNLMVIPNNVLGDVAAAHRLLYPEDSIYVIYPKDFTPSKRHEVLDRIKNEDFTAIYMSYSSFDMIKMSLDYKIRKLKKEIQKCQAQINRCGNQRVRVSLNSELKKLQDRLLKLYDKEADDKGADCFDLLGITAIFVDEGHNYKNISLEAGIGSSVVGFHSKGSSKADEMLEKVDCVRNDGGRIIFATGTPLTNSLADVYVLQRYLQPAELSMCEISRFPQWLNTFVERETSFEIDVDAHNFRMKTRFSRFHNLPELMSMFSSVCDFYHNTQEVLNLPDFDGYSDISVKRSYEQKAYMKKLVERTEKIRLHEVDRSKDNLLKVTVDGRKCALDIRLVDPEIKTEQITGKLRSCTTEIMRLRELYPDNSQLVFCDISTPKEGFNVYDALKQMLINAGMKEEEIAFVHDGKTEKKKKDLFGKVNSGKIKVMIGSTQKLGTGVNVQEKLIAIHHLDIPWRTSDMVQRQGRLIRNGNLCKKVYVFRYVTECSFDSYTYQILENKQKFISSFLSGTMNSEHRFEKDIDDLVLDYAEIKALAIGNPLIRRRVELANEIERLKIARRQKQSQLRGLQNLIAEYPQKRQRLISTMSQVESDYYYYCDHKRNFTKEEQKELGELILKELKTGTMREKPKLFGMIYGFKMMIPGFMLENKPCVQLQYKNGPLYFVDMKNAKVMGCWRRIVNVLEGLDDRWQKLSDRKRQLMTERNAAELELGKGNPFEPVIEEKYRELENIDLQLKNA